jgi:hypothetical protein
MTNDTPKKTYSNGKWNIITGIIAAGAVALSMFSLRSAITNEGRMARLEEFRLRFTTQSDFARARSDVSTALTVLGGHGSELQGIRAEILIVRSRLDQLHTDIQRRMDDRFRLQDWLREKKILQLRFDVMIRAIEQMGGKVEDG